MFAETIEDGSFSPYSSALTACVDSSAISACFNLNIGFDAETGGDKLKYCYLEYSCDGVSSTFGHGSFCMIDAPVEDICGSGNPDAYIVHNVFYGVVACPSGFLFDPITFFSCCL